VLIRPIDKTKVAFVVWTLEGMGGSEKLVYDLCGKLDRNKYDVIVISLRDGPVREQYEQIGTKVYVTSEDGRSCFWSKVAALRKILFEEFVHVVNAHHFGPLLYSFFATMFSSIRLVYTEHSQWQLEQLPLFLKILNRIFLGRVYAVVAISKQIQDYYLDKLWLRSEKVHLIFNGIDLAAFKRGDKHHAEQLRQGLGIRTDEKVIGSVANLRPEKNHKLLISAFSLAAKSVANVRLVLVGADCMEGEIQRFARHSGVSDRILFLGKREDVPDLLSIFDIFCLPSVHEGLPLTVLEAMASGIPVIGTDVLGINELVVNNVNGLLTPSNNVKNLSEGILLLLTDEHLRKRLSRTAKKLVDENYDLDKKVEEYESLFHLVAGDTHCKTGPLI
jgi:glycosyltransferase involved in cell wall biosynthesis